ncbi:hypothetical protein G7Y89_g10378 [Cudoniella acicularis]|uniref:Uncharacterized protein n=1 Tax=Cudoniella acicularis TaxID=354080 RepID=A0A8H4RFP2_9HELO|nr:hypothetical protein G7Y89_g10378 [Cudoniella acicularis]
MRFLSIFLLFLPCVLVCDASQVKHQRQAFSDASGLPKSSNTSGAPFGNATSTLVPVSSSTSTPFGTGLSTTISVPLSTRPTLALPTTSSTGLSTNDTTISVSLGTTSSISSSIGTGATDNSTSTAAPSSSTSNSASSSSPTETLSSTSSSTVGTTVNSNSTSSATESSGTTSSAAASGSSSTSSLPGTGVLPFPTTSSSPSSSTSGNSAVPFSFSGTWSASSTASPVAFTWFDIPTTTISDTAATSEAVFLGGLFFALQANRQWITDATLRSQYIDDVKKTKDEVIALWNSLSVQPPADPECSNTKKKRNLMSEKKLRSLLRERSLISGLTDLIGDVAKLISCAVNVVTNLVDAVEAEIPTISVIETLTDTLADIANDLENEDDPTSTESQPSSTEQSSLSSSSSSSSSSCTGSTAIPVCTETISLSTSFISGGTSSFMVATITSTACTTTTIAGCTSAGTTATTTTSSSGPTCTNFQVPTEDDPEEDGTDLDPNDLKIRSVAGRIKLEARARAGPTSFGSCPVPDGFAKITFPGIPTVNQVFKIEGSTKPTDQPLLNGIARYYDRNVKCDGTTNVQKRDSSSLDATSIKGYSMDHAWELKFLLEFFKTITPPVSSSVFTDCNNFNEVFFPAPCNNIMQTLYNQVATNTDSANGNQIEFVAMLKDLNNKKGVIFKANEFTNSNWKAKNLPAGNINAWIVVLQDVGIAMAICQDSNVVPLFDKTNLRIYNAFQGIDQLVATKKIALKNTAFSFADTYQTWINAFLTQQAGATWTFIQQLMTDTQTAITALADSDPTKANLQTWLDNFKNGAFGQESHYSFSFNTNLASAGGSALAFKRSIFARQVSCPLQSGSSSSIVISTTEPISSASISATGKLQPSSISTTTPILPTTISTNSTDSTSLQPISTLVSTMKPSSTPPISTIPSTIKPSSSTPISIIPSTIKPPSSIPISSIQPSTSTPATSIQLPSTSSAPVSAPTVVPPGPRQVCTPHSDGNIAFTRAQGIDAINRGCGTGLFSRPLPVVGQTYDFAIFEGSVNVTGTIGLSLAGQTGCNAQTTNLLSFTDCQSYFTQAMDNCDTNTVTAKYGAKPLTLNTANGCLDINFYGTVRH